VRAEGRPQQWNQPSSGLELHGGAPDYIQLGNYMGMVVAIAPATVPRLTNVSVGAASAQLPAVPLANRKGIRITNSAQQAAGNTVQTVYIGYTPAVLAGPPVGGQAQGLALQPGQSVYYALGIPQAPNSLYGIVPAGTTVLQVEEVA
jgi:hypothetical protein